MIDLNRARTIQFRLLSLVTLIVVPLVCLFAWMALEIGRTERKLIEAQRSNITREMSQGVDRLVSLHVGMLESLAVLPLVKSGTPAEIDQQFAALGQTPHVMRIWQFSVNDPGPDADLSPQFKARVLAGETAISGLKGQNLSDASFIVGVLVHHSTLGPIGIAAEIKADYLGRKLFKEFKLNQNWVVALVDRNNRFIARSLDSEARVGQTARPELGIAANGIPQSGIFDNYTLEGVHMYNSFYRSSLTGWTTVVAVPKAILAEPLNRNIALVLLGGSAVLLLTLAVASIQARRISEPVRSLSDFADALSEGRPHIEIDHQIQELEEVSQALEKIMAKNAHLGALVSSSADAILSVGLDGKVLSWNSGAETIFGYTAEEIIGLPKTVLIPKDRAEEFQIEREQVISGQPARLETIRLRRDGTPVEVAITSAPIRKPDNSIFAISSIVHDISDRRASEAHVRLLMRELAHRSKNQIAVIQAIARRTSRNAASLTDFSNSFGQRLQALAASYDLLIQRNWTSVKLKDLIEAQLRVFNQTSGSQLTISGPDVELEAAYAEAIGLALHELATNAVKYGAWSRPTGLVSVSWSLKNATDGPPVLDLNWIESGGPTVEAANEKGFGSTVIESMVASAVNGTATVRLEPDGLQWNLQCPLKSPNGEIN